MSREIKFRAWDKKHKKMTTVNSVVDLHLHYHPRPLLTLLRGGELYGERRLDKVELMQYTGLTDVNGVDIYEHDLVKHGSRLQEVIWVETMCCFKLRNRDKSLDEDDMWLNKSHTLKIVGNIYEDKGLLNE